MDNNFILEIKEKSDIVDIISQYVTLKNSGSNYKACCPFHKENSPSFVVSETKQIFKCFGCGKSGDVIKFVEFIENVEFIEAVKILAEKLNIELPQNNFVSSKNTNEINIYIEINTIVARQFYKNLVNSKFALSYLQNRGITSEMIREFGLGYAADTTDNLLKELEANFSRKHIIESGIVSEKNGRIYLRFRNRIIFPIFDSRNRVIGFGGRQVDNFGPKYLNSPETKLFLKKDNLYALNIAKKNLLSNHFFLVEGYMDVIKMHQYGFKNTVASLGTAFTTEQARLLKKYSNKLYIVYDSDDAGISASLRALEVSLKENIDCRVVTLQNAKDPDDFLTEYGSVMFNRLVDDADDYLMFNIKVIQKKYNDTTDFNKTDFISDSVTFIKKYLETPNSSHIYVEKAIRYLSENTGYALKSIGQDIFGKYFSVKQFSISKNEPDFSEKNGILATTVPLDLVEIDSREKVLLRNLKKGTIDIDLFNINDFFIRENRLIFYKIKNDINVDEYDLSEYDKILNNEEAILVRTNMCNSKLESQIEFFEKKQIDLLSKSDDISMHSALIIGQYIINLNSRKNK